MHERAETEDEKDRYERMGWALLYPLISLTTAAYVHMMLSTEEA
jgi:hypothetical protein